ncbi:hypothetical protein BCR35DRAFT_300501 [Leucosporidium creatinivorum]|uniref:F-box domain-containing protein n=1 Tax=Leucosporidium creatinivorum TaxID=106004 RepID=A0A1Y2G0H0_9BASI|nr:hypothetical protein BCR35DRAFT_300501 [Leucosporidium creatinivorum]
MPTLRKRKPSVSESDPLSLLSDEEEQEAYVQKPVKKKSKAKSTPKRKIKGSLGSFAALPLDVVAEIASQADLGTVLALARLNKSCRSLLTSKRMEAFWDQARENAGLPKLKADNSPNLIELAELMYGTHCMHCHKSTSKLPYLGLYSRYCTKCAGELLYASYGSFPLMRSSYDCAGRERSKLEYLLEDHEEYCALTNSARRDYSTDKREQEMEDRKEDELALATWWTARDDEKAAQRETVKESRKAAIEAHFRELGWTERSLASDAFQQHSKVNVARELTDRTRDDVFAALTLVLEADKERVEEENRAEEARLAEERLVEERDLRKDHLNVLWTSLLAETDAQKAAGLFPLPPWDEFAELESVKLLYYPEDASFDKTSTMEDSYPSITAEIDELRQSIKSELVAKFAQALSTATSSPVATSVPVDIPKLPSPAGPDNTFTDDQRDSLLDLATTVFTCNDKNLLFVSRGCGAVGTWSSIFSHKCHRAGDEPVYSLKAASYQVETSQVELAVKLIEIAGLDPDTATTDDMEALGRGFSCVACKSPSFSSISRTWTQMLRHLSSRHYYRYSRETHDLDIVCEDEEAAIARLLKASAEHSSEY